jgi:hypothetical protein
MSRRFWRPCKKCRRSFPMAKMRLVYADEKRSAWWWECLDDADCEAHQ